MNKFEAIEILREFANYTIADIYDTYDDATDALHVIKPDFEYPDFDYWKVASFLRSQDIILI